MLIPLRDYIDQIRSAIEPILPLAAASQLKIQPDRFFFANGTEFHGGTYFIPDPKTRAKHYARIRTTFPATKILAGPAGLTGKNNWREENAMKRLLRILLLASGALVLYQGTRTTPARAQNSRPRAVLI